MTMVSYGHTAPEEMSEEGGRQEEALYRIAVYEP